MNDHEETLSSIPVKTIAEHLTRRTAARNRVIGEILARLEEITGWKETDILSRNRTAAIVDARIALVLYLVRVKNWSGSHIEKTLTFCHTVTSYYAHHEARRRIARPAFDQLMNALEL